MMMSHRLNSPAAQRFAGRRQREDEAPKLLAEVPDLLSLQMQIEERSGVGGTKHLRRFLVDRAPALFLVPCGDPRCIDGEHDLTMEIMHALRGRQTTFSGHDDCRGAIGSSPCLRVLHFDARAEYRV